MRWAQEVSSCVLGGLQEVLCESWEKKEEEELNAEGAKITQRCREKVEGDYFGGGLRWRFRPRKVEEMVTIDATTMNEAKARWMLVEFDKVIVSQVMSQRTSDHVMSSMMFNGVPSYWCLFDYIG